MLSIIGGWIRIVLIGRGFSWVAGAGLVFLRGDGRAIALGEGARWCADRSSFYEHSLFCFGSIGFGIVVVWNGAVGGCAGSDVEGFERIFSVHTAEEFGDLEGAAGGGASSDPGFAGVMADAGEDPVECGDPWADRSRGSHGGEGVFRECAGFFCDGQLVSSEGG